MRALEFITEAVTDNYLYHSVQSVGTFRKIISTGEIKPYTPIEYEENDIELPVISASRNQYYRFPYGGGNIQFVIDKNALKQSGFKVKPYSYAQHYATKKGQSSVTGNELYKQETEEQIFPIKGHGIPVRSPYIVGIQINPKFKDTSELEEIQELAKSINIPISFMKMSTKPLAKKVDIKLTPKFDPNRFIISAATGAAKEYFPLMMTDKNNPGRKWGLEANYTNADINHILQSVTEDDSYQYPPEKESIRMTEIIQMPPIKKNIDINAMYKTALINIKSGQASRLVGLNIGAPNIIVRSPDMYQIYVFDQNKNPIFYAGMSKFHNGLKTGAVASSPEGRGQGYGWKIYNAMSHYLKVPLYSDSTQTDDSRIGIWQQLIKNFPNRVVGYNQVGKQDVNTHDVYQNLPSKDLADVGDDTRRQTLLLKLLP